MVSFCRISTVRERIAARDSGLMLGVGAFVRNVFTKIESSSTASLSSERGRALRSITFQFFGLTKNFNDKISLDFKTAGNILIATV